MPILKFPAPKLKLLPIVGDTEMYPVVRIFCVGRNYVAHANEMGGDVDREMPWYFTKSSQALCQSAETVPYPTGTSNYHHEMELVIALGKPAFRIEKERALDAVFGYACGFDMTRRDRQQEGKNARRPWSLGKDIENGAVVGAITPKQNIENLGPQRIALQVNGTSRQEATLSDMVWSVDEIISHLSKYYHLNAGDLIMTGTPAGVGPIVAGDVITGQIDELTPISHRLSDPE